jgi:hypothetical protein
VHDIGPVQTVGSQQCCRVVSDLECTWKGAVVATSAHVTAAIEGKCGDTPSD